MPDSNSAAKPASAATRTSRTAAAPLVKSEASPSVQRADTTPVPPTPAAAQNPPPQAREHFPPKILFGIFGAAGGIGKSLDADTVATLYRTVRVPVRLIRMESGVRREEFANDAFIDLDEFAGAATQVGGIAALFDPAWALIEQTFADGGIAIIDGGANSHDKFVTLALETGLSQLVAEQGGRTILMVVLTRDAELIRQSVKLVGDLRGFMPEAEIIVVLNERDGSFLDDATPEGRAYSERLQPLLKPGTYVTMPLAGARAIAAFASCGRSITEIMAATDDELMRYSGLRLLAARSCQTHLSAYFLDFTSRLKQVLPFPPAA